jgi:hypothetical protein
MFVEIVHFGSWQLTTGGLKTARTGIFVDYAGQRLKRHHPNALSARTQLFVLYLKL